MHGSSEEGLEKLRSLVLEHELESSPSGICVVDGGGRIVIWNQRFLDLWGLTAQEVENRPFKAWVQHIQDKLEAPTVFQSLYKTTQGEQEFKGFVEIGLKDGRVLKLDIFPLLKEGEYFGRVYYFTDVTEGRRGEEVMTEYASELQRIVASRTQELIEAERLAASGSLAREIAHDLRSPLQSIRNAVYMMKRDPNKFSVGLEIIEKSILRSLEMLEGLRDSSRLDEPRLRKSDLNKIILESVEEIPKPSNVSINVELDEEAEAWVDGPRMRRVFDNLLLNAIEAMPKGGTITITKQRVGNKYIIQISDTGVGIPEDVLSTLFHRKFYTTKPHGLGLGLSYCKRTVESHGGSIMVDSVLGKGTVFTIELPKVD